jgi:hypothetical protein
MIFGSVITDVARSLGPLKKTKPPRGVYSLDGFATLVTGQIPATS